ncbi:hypothetical protein ACSX1A_04040 [Pontibacter sp. MBLB2868]|uniref:hypothetical protein n=1 Tax=Pontibacter sp. MBLB2868 TaxID=3451555 RepID=UPI003F7545FE
MKVHVIRSFDYSKVEYEKVVKLLQGQAGPLQFVKGTAAGHAQVWSQEKKLFDRYVAAAFRYKKDFDFANHTMSLGWNEFFDLADMYRETNRLLADDFIVLLTPVSNSNNWFTSFSKESNTIFIHTEDWGRYLPCDPAYPIAYLAMSQVVEKIYYKDIQEKVHHAHPTPVGCMSDFCQKKSDIIFKLRTADICPDCIDDMVGAGVRGDVINQAIMLFEKTRNEMLFRQRFKQLPSRLHISRGNVIQLLDYQGKVIDLAPLEKTVFFLFLKHPEGILLKNRAQYRQEVEAIYRKLTIYTPGDEVQQAELEKELSESARALTDPLDNSMSEKITRIKSKFTKELGAETAKYYSIQGERGQLRKILLNRTMVSCESSIFTEDIFPSVPLEDAVFQEVQ